MPQNLRDWQGLTQGVERFTQGLLERKKQEQKLQQALQLLMQGALVKQQIQQQDPSYQMNQLKMAQALEQMQRQAQFQRMGDVGYGGARPTAQEALPFVPQQLQQRFMQRPTSPPGFVGQQIRRPFEQAGQTLLPGASGWQRTKLPSAIMKPQSEVKQQEESIKIKIARGEQLTPEEINYYNRFMWRTGAEMKQPKKDKFGFSLGQTYKDYKYIGNNKWQR